MPCLKCSGLFCLRACPAVSRYIYIWRVEIAWRDWGVFFHSITDACYDGGSTFRRKCFEDDCALLRTTVLLIPKWSEIRHFFFSFMVLVVCPGHGRFSSIAVFLLFFIRDQIGFWEGSYAPKVRSSIEKKKCCTSIVASVKKTNKKTHFFFGGGGNRPASPVKAVVSSCRTLPPPFRKNPPPTVLQHTSILLWGVLYRSAVNVSVALSEGKRDSMIAIKPSCQRMRGFPMLTPRLTFGIPLQHGSSPVFVYFEHRFQCAPSARINL